MGREESKNAVIVTGRRRQVLSSDTRRALKVVGTGALTGAAAGMAVGGSIGIAALGTAVGAPLIAVGAVVGVGVASIWNLFFGKDQKRAQLIQDELEKNWIRPRLTRLTGDERDRHTSAYEQWLRLPTSPDLQKFAIARLVERSFPRPKKPRKY